MRKIKIVLITVLLCFLVNPLFIFAQDIKGSQILIDTAVKNKSSVQVRNVLRKYHKSDEYNQIEEYSKLWIRKIIIKGDLDFATDLIFVVIESNIDCDYEDDEALDLYGELISVYSLTR